MDSLADTSAMVRSVWRRYALAAISVAGALLLTRAPILGPGGVGTFFFVAVTLAAAVGGVGPGVLATVLSSTAQAYLLLSSLGSFAVEVPHAAALLAARTAEALAIALLVGGLRASRERIRAAAEEARYRATLLDGIPAILAYWDRSRRNVVANRTFQEWFGIAPESMHGLHMRDVLGAETYAGSEKFIEAALQGTPQRFDRPLVDAAGVERHVETCYLPDVRDGEVRGMFVQATDVTARKRAEEELDRRVAERTRELTEANAGLRREVERRRAAEEAQQASEQMFQELFMAAPDGILVAGPAGRIELANAAAATMFGMRGEVPTGRIVDELLPSLASEAPPGAPRAIVLARDLTARRTDGSEFPAGVSAAPFAFDGRATTLLIVHDKTERVTLERSLLQAEERAQRAQRMESIGRLAGGVAHDFNNLLSVMLSYAEIGLHSVREGDPVREHLGEIRSAGLRASELTKQLLAFSRQQVVQPRIIDLNATLASMDKMLRRLLGEDIDLAARLAPSLGRVKVDPSQVEQILLNLAVNARDAMPRGGKLTIETQNVDLDEDYARLHPGSATGPHVMLAVSDDGTGMDAATLQRIFEPFFTTKGLGKGTGLGLATVYGIVAQGGGSISVYSELGRGTTFKVYFPRADGTNATPAPERRATLATGGTETILLAEDEPQLRALLAVVLQRAGYQVLAAASPDEAVRASEQHSGPVDLLLTDVVMPGMNGRQLAERLQPARPAMKVLYMSGYTTNVVIHHGVLDEGVAFLQKPVTPDVVLRRVREVLGSTRMSP